MLIDLSVLVNEEQVRSLTENGGIPSFGHLGTHFDVMDKVFPLEFVRRQAVVFDVSNLFDRDITSSDIDLEQVEAGMFVLFCTGYIELQGYGTKAYSDRHPQLSKELIDELLKKSISMIGVDFAGVRRGKEHTLTDQYCADHGVFIVENICNLAQLLKNEKAKRCIIHTYPVNFAGWSGLPCRVVAETNE